MIENESINISVEAVIDAVAEDAERGPDAIRRAMDPFTDDGVLTSAAIQSTISDTSKILATAETRVDLADLAFEEARTAANTVTDVDIVSVRLNSFENRLTAMKTRTAELGRVVEMPVGSLTTPETAYRSAIELRETAASAQRIVRHAEDLATDLERFESWLDSPDHRHEEFATDIDIVEESLQELSDVSDRLGDAAESLVTEWANATVRTRVLELLVADLRTEAADLQTWAAREDARFPEELPQRIDAIDRRVTTVSERLDELATPRWHDRFEDDLERVQRKLAEFDPPIVWDRVHETISDTQYTASLDNTSPASSDVSSDPSGGVF